VVSGFSSILQQPDKRIDLTDILNHLITAKVRIRRISGRERRERVQVLERLAVICGPGGILVVGVEYDLSVDSYARHSYRGCELLLARRTQLGIKRQRQRVPHWRDDEL